MIPIWSVCMFADYGCDFVEGNHELGKLFASSIFFFFFKFDSVKRPPLTTFLKY